MQRYLVFSGNKFYPSGGIFDFDYDTDDLEDAKNTLEELMLSEMEENPGFYESEEHYWKLNFGQVYDSLTKKMIVLK